ncbi:UNVERIFIED_CONTAM: hypothetical protein PYX00_011465 [Menopon gallinae]|uniref:Uncharacterized protein n=1 Tax=Menopon gallinae TaxID=328185 RepID=A0AAW2H7P6_9NEOP
MKDDADGDVRNTIGIDFVPTTVMVDGVPIRMQIWDTAGQERYWSITKSYYRGAHGVFIVFDLTSKKSFAAVCKLMEHILAEVDTSTHKMLVGNKSDKFSREELAEAEALYAQKAKELKICFLAVSAFSGRNIENMFVAMGRMLLRSQKDREATGGVLDLQHGSGRGPYLGRCC